MEGCRGTTDEFATIPFHFVVFSAALVELAKSIHVHSLILSSHLFFCLPLFLFPFTMPCRIVFAKPEDFETRERIRFTFNPRDMFLSLQMGFSFERAAVACAILEQTSGLEPSSEKTAPRYCCIVGGNHGINVRVLITQSNEWCELPNYLSLKRASHI